ncbi:MAG: Serine/threonine protein kinase PrkC, regulator of stationary phase [Myxococcaceae bacterium]|nr:Serine/threonine protein kinase PrkC, regulator of stationary phase [Myxococcaceae bacterium]
MTTQAPKPTQPDELVGRVINDRFRIISVIARGGMGRVYRAEQVPLGRLVAIKTLDPRHTGGEHDPQFQQRFFLEASVASKLQHPNTVTVFDYGRTVDDLYFIAMELVEGRSLLNLVRQEAPLPAARVIHIALQIARSLREAHRLDVIHRDLKPGNVLLAHHGDEDDFVKVLDFGLVKHIETEAEQELTKAGLFMGSPKYMSPEQIRGERVDGRSDIYSLGVVMYEMLSGKVPFDRENTVKVLMAHMHEPVPPLLADGCPEGLTQLVMRCLAKDAQFRPNSMDEVIALLKHSSGAYMSASGSFALSQEVRLSQTPPPAGQYVGQQAQVYTPSRGFAYGPGSVAQPLPSESAVHQTFPSVVPVPFPGEQPARAPTSWLPKVAVLGSLVIAGGFLALRFAERGSSFSVQPLPQAAHEQAAHEQTAHEQAAERAGNTGEAAAASDNQPGTAGSSPVAALGSTPGTPGTTPAAAGDTQARAQRHVLVRLTSNPSGATVTADGKVYGTTPADIEWWGDLAAADRQITFVFEKAGHEPITAVRSIHGDELNVEATLPRIAASSPRRHRPSRAAGAAGEPTEGAPAAPATAPVVVPQDFKQDPY